MIPPISRPTLRDMIQRDLDHACDLMPRGGVPEEISDELKAKLRETVDDVWMTYAPAEQERERAK